MNFKWLYNLFIIILLYISVSDAQTQRRRRPVAARPTTTTTTSTTTTTTIKSLEDDFVVNEDEIISAVNSQNSPQTTPQTTTTPVPTTTTTTTTTTSQPSTQSILLNKVKPNGKLEQLLNKESNKRNMDFVIDHNKPKAEQLTNNNSIPEWLFGSDNDVDREIEYEGYNGWYNNKAHHHLGANDMPLVRLVTPKYSDGVYQPSGDDRPNPIALSEAFMKGEIGEVSATGKTAFFVFFGQQVVEEILDVQRAGCPPEYFYIDIPREVFAENGTKVAFSHSTGHTKMPFVRSRYVKDSGQSTNNARQQLNEITPWIDGGLMYGIAKGWSDALRSFKDGQLDKFEDASGGQFPAYNNIKLPLANPPPPSGPHKWKGNEPNNTPPNPRLLPVSRFFKLGNPRGNENPFLLTMGVLWFRWHNLLAHVMKKKYPHMKDEKIYNEARKWVIASYQKIVIYDWLPLLLGEQLPKYNEYDGSIDPQVTHVFQSAAFRFGHTLVTSGAIKRSGDCSTADKLDIPHSHHSASEHIVRTCNNFWKPIDPLLGGGFEEIIMGMSSQPAEREDNVVVEDLRGNVFGPLEFTRRDLMAINIQRGRDHGLPDYLSARKELGLDSEERYEKLSKNIKEVAETLWSENIKRNPTLLDKAIEIYGNSTDKIDIWVGGLLETTTRGPGTLFRYIILDQFQRIRNGDRFWFENHKNNLFTPEQINRIKQLTIYDIIVSIANIKDDEIQRNPFRLPTEESNPLSSPCMSRMLVTYPCMVDTADGVKNETCKSLGAVNRSRVVNDECTAAHTFDYFDGSETSYALTFVGVGVFAIICIITLKVLVDRKLAFMDSERKQNTKLKRMTLSEDITLAQEWVGKREGLRSVQILTNSPKKAIIIKPESSDRALRNIDLKDVKSIQIHASTNKAQDYLLVKFTKEYDLVIKFDSYYERERFASKIESFLEEIGVGRERFEIDLNTMLATAYTKQKRQKHLEQFFRVVFSHAFNVSTKEDSQIDSKTAKEVINTELTQFEFADALSLRPDSMFIQQMFALVDKDNNGYISFREFLDMIIIFAKGTAEQKAKLMFDMYDVDRTERLSINEFRVMIKSMLELANQTISAAEIDEVLSSMFTTAGLKTRQELTFADFQKLLSDYKEELGYAELNFDVSAIQGVSTSSKRQSAMIRANDTVVRAYSYFGGVADPSSSQSKLTTLATSTDTPATHKKSMLRVETQERKYEPDWVLAWKRFSDEYKLEIFWITIYTAIIIYFFLDKCYTYTYLREHGGLRQIAGLGVTLTRGAASVMMFTFSTILLTMCRNIITFLRETFLHRFVPFDGAVSLHKYIAFWALIFSILHSIGHAINFYHISTQSREDTTCLFREFYHASDQLPKFHYWCWSTITGITGVSLLCLIILMYVFAIHYSRRHIFNAFWSTHNLYPFLYILMVLHGLGRIVQPPIFYYYFVIPVILFVIDRLISVSRKKVEISVIRAVLHPSEVTGLEFKRPPGFEYKSGQWVRIACLSLNSNEYHPFTLASAPHEDNLALYIRAVGPFTKNLRQTYDPNNLGRHAYPKLYLDGPYGEGHQDWLRYDVSVLVGGGIGVTPFASILKDIAFRSGLNSKFTCKKVYFLWVTRTQKHFEWMSDVIRDTEEKDKSNLLRTHIFITQFYEKFDLRTTMLYICERHFQRVSNRSLFTGLKAKTHFGRPNFTVFLDSLQQEHPNVSRVGVFSCGPGPMTNNVQQACETLNRKEGAIFVHHFENF